MLAGADELDRHSGDGFDRQRRAAAGIAVELGHDDAVEPHRLVERLGAVDGILAGHAVDNQIDLLGIDPLVDLLQLLHQLVVDVQPAGGVEDDDLNAFTAGFFDRVVAHLHRIGRARLGIDRNAKLFAEHVQLLDSGRSLKVGGDEHRLLARVL